MTIFITVRTNQASLVAKAFDSGSRVCRFWVRKRCLTDSVRPTLLSKECALHILACQIPDSVTDAAGKRSPSRRYIHRPSRTHPNRFFRPACVPSIHFARRLQTVIFSCTQTISGRHTDRETVRRGAALTIIRPFK